MAIYFAAFGCFCGLLGHVPARDLLRAANIKGHRRSLTSRQLFVCRGSVQCTICGWHLALPPAGRRSNGYAAGFSPAGAGMGSASRFTSISRSFKSPSTRVSRAFRSWLRLRMSSRFRQSIASFWKQNSTECGRTTISLSRWLPWSVFSLMDSKRCRFASRRLHSALLSCKPTCRVRKNSIPLPP